MRRVVTGHDERGRAIVLLDGEAANRRTGAAGNSSTLMWCTDRTPADIAVGEGVEDMGARMVGTPPPAGGSRFTVNEILPGSSGKMHRTESIDYVIVLIGEVDMELDGSMVTMRAGDVMVQRGTNHRWINRSSEPARVAFVLIDAQPLGLGHPLERDIKAG